MTCSKEWTSIPPVLTDLLPTCNLVVNAQGCTGRNRAKRSSDPSRQAKLEKEHNLAPSVWREWHHVKQPDQERRNSHTCIVTPTFCWRSQSPSAVSPMRSGCTQRLRDPDNDMLHGVG